MIDRKGAFLNKDLVIHWLQLKYQKLKATIRVQLYKLEVRFISCYTLSCDRQIEKWFFLFY